MIKIIITGGTIDKQYNELNGELYFEQTHISAMLQQARCTLPVLVEPLILKDSLDMTLEDREKIKQICLTSTEKHIIITHGTDTLVDTAKFIAADAVDKTIILFGAMVPFSFAHSDALFNLGGAIYAVQTVGKGVFITMNGRIFNWDNVHKNKELGVFQKL